MKLGKKHNACKACVNAAQKKQYAGNKAYYLERNRDRRSEMRVKYKALKEATPCARCGQFYPHYVTDYDHKDPASKKLCVSKMMGYSWGMIEAELSKCELLCANCHRTKTYETSNRQQQHRITTRDK